MTGSIVVAMTPAAVAQAQLDAYNARDLERFCALFAADVQLLRPPATAPALQGLDALRHFYETERFNRPALHAELLHRAVIGSRVIDHERIHGVREQPFEMVAVFQIDAGLITRMWSFLPD